MGEKVTSETVKGAELKFCEVDEERVVSLLERL